MSDNVHVHWRSTEPDHGPAEPDVPKESPNVKPAPTPIKVSTAHIAVEANHVSMRLAAVTGIILVLAAFATFYFGIDFLRASLTGTAPHEVMITADGTFWPDTLTVAPGDEIIFMNDNADPQVIKNKESEALFDRPAIFPTEEETMQIPAATPAGVYTFYSETLSPDIIFTLTVTSGDSGNATSSQAATTMDDAIGEIMIPSLREAAASQQMQSSSASLEPPAPSAVIEEQPHLEQPIDATPPVTTQPIVPSLPPIVPNAAENDIPLFSLGANAMTGDPFAESAEVPVNPYTVGNLGARPLPTGTQSQELHSGAPLRTYRPASQPTTGPSTWLAIFLATLTLGIGLRVVATTS